MATTSPLLLIDKTYDTILAEAVSDLQDTGISDQGAGGVARLILKKMSSLVSGFYDDLQVQHVQAFLSQATDKSLDAIGQLLNCERSQGEDDNNYKYRISKQTLSLEKANETSIRLSVLTIDPVKDVILKEFSHGTGSFSVYPVFDGARDWDLNTIDLITNRVQANKGFGTRAEILQPRITPVEIRVRLLFDQRTAEIDKTLIRNQATQLIRNYIVTMKPGDTIQIQRLINSLMQVSTDIVNVDIYHFTVNDRPMNLVDQTSAWNERFAESENPGAILVS